MTIQLELDPEFVERLSAEAKARGIGWEEYAESLLREAIATRSDSQGTLTVAELNTMLKTIAEGADRLPKLSTSPFTRESFNEERP